MDEARELELLRKLEAAVCKEYLASQALKTILAESKRIRSGNGHVNHLVKCIHVQCAAVGLSLPAPPQEQGQDRAGG